MAAVGRRVAEAARVASLGPAVGRVDVRAKRGGAAALEEVGRVAVGASVRVVPRPSVVSGRHASEAQDVVAYAASEVSRDPTREAAGFCTARPRARVAGIAERVYGEYGRRLFLRVA